MPITDIHSTKTDCVVVDTNIWRSALLLKTTLGQTLVYTIGRLKACLGLPEIIERELKSQVVDHGLQSGASYEKHGRILDTLVGLGFSPEMPTVKKLEKAVDDRLEELEPVLVRVPFTMQHAESALALLIAKLPPNAAGDQQFKDSAIWQAVKDLATAHRVYFVTEDRAFLADRKNPDLGLATNLRAECDGAGIEVELHLSLKSCLASLRGAEPSYDKARLTSLIATSVSAEMSVRAKGNKFTLGDLAHGNLSAFRTDNVNKLAIDFRITMACTPDDSSLLEEARDFETVSNGTCYYDRATGAIWDVFLDAVDVRWKYLRGGHGRSCRGYDGDPAIPFYPSAN